jgi:hypothetical protein
MLMADGPTGLVEMPFAAPPEFLIALWDEIEEAGHYRTSPAIEFVVEHDVISMTMTSTIVPIGPTKIDCPEMKPAKGLSVVRGSERYFLGGKQVDLQGTQIDVPAQVDDRYCVTFERSGPRKKVTDTHTWSAPNTGFEVTFRYDRNKHKCAVEKVSRPKSAGLLSERLGDCEIFRYPRASFYSQSFTWRVDWNR